MAIANQFNAGENNLNENIIMISELSRKFGEFTAVFPLVFNVKKGEILGFLGPNGAGKTTTIKMLTTLLHPTTGSAQISGYDIQKDREMVRQSIGIVFQDPSLDMDLTGRENLRFHGLLYRMSEDQIKKKIAELLPLVDLTDWIDKPVRTYSGGMRRRLEIIRSLIHSPQVLFLDEPTVGLDPQSRRKIWDFLREINQKEQLTIFLTTHYMEEADQLCNRVAIIDHGKIEAFDIPSNLKMQVGGDVIILDVGTRCKELLPILLAKFPQIITKGEISTNTIQLTCKEGEKTLPQLIRFAAENLFTVNSVSLKKPGLDDVFLHFTGTQIRDQNSENNPMTRMQMKKMMRKGGGM